MLPLVRLVSSSKSTSIPNSILECRPIRLKVNGLELFKETHQSLLCVSEHHNGSPDRATSFQWSVNEWSIDSALVFVLCKAQTPNMCYREALWTYQLVSIMRSHMIIERLDVKTCAVQELIHAIKLGS